MDTCFYVNNKPFFPLGGEFHNSSTQSEEEMEHGWKALEYLRANTVEAPIHWELIEPQEGRFNFKQIDWIIHGARKHGFKVILLWFGTWKNGKMEYAPHWIKKNTNKFKRVITYDSIETGVLSCHCSENLSADRKAFCAVMEYLKEIDSEEKTVIGIQVENEPGNDCRTIRDHGDQAEKEYMQPVSQKLLTYIKALSDDSLVKKSWIYYGAIEQGNWDQVFGPDGAEFFTAAAIAQYINSIAKAGKAIYSLPMIVNAWNGDCGYKIPGIDYPTGGPGSKVFDLWKFYSPDIDIIGPDIYLANPEQFSQTCILFHRLKNPMFIPESPRKKSNEWALFHTVGKHQAIGYFMFGIEDILLDGQNFKPELLTVIQAFRATADILPLIITHHNTGNIHTVLQEESVIYQYLYLNNYLGIITFGEPEKSDYRHRFTSQQPRRGSGLIIQNNSKEFFCIGGGFCIDFAPIPQRETSEAVRFISSCRTRTYITIEEGFFDKESRWQVTRTRNGDLVNFSTWIYGDNRVVRIVLD